MSESRYSSPPEPAKLVASTDRLTAALDVLERRVGAEPLPAAVAIAALDLTDEQRLAALREFKVALDKRPGAPWVALREYEEAVRRRLGR